MGKECFELDWIKSGQRLAYNVDINENDFAIPQSSAAKISYLYLLIL